MRRNEYDISGHLHIFAILNHLMVLLRYNFFRASFLHLIKDTIIIIIIFFFIYNYYF